MGIKEEIEIYSRAKILGGSGEVETYDRIVFPNVIRKREIERILELVQSTKPKKILDFGCGAGWLSKALSSHGYHTVGIDSSRWLISNATELPSDNSHFLTGDCMNLPFQDDTFDLILGVAILHHLDPNKALEESRRVATKGARLLLIEPNRLNVISALGRKICPPDMHTKGERPFSPRELKGILSAENWNIETFDFLFPYSFALAYLLGKTDWRDNQRLKPICLPVEKSERLLEKVPFLNRLSWAILVVAKKV